MDNIFNAIQRRAQREARQRASMPNTSMPTNTKATKVASKPKVKAKPKVDPMDNLGALVQKYNDYIHANDLNDETIEYLDYMDKNRPSFIDGKEGIGEEMNYVQNRLWKVQNDKRYVPDYEDMKLMGDNEFNDYLDKTGSGKVKKESYNDVYTGSDDNFTKELDSKIDSEPQPRQRF